MLLSINNLRFALAHISWPWTDECIAVYGKFCNVSRNTVQRQNSNAEMFIDMTPGTPQIYRADAIKKLLCVGYDIDKNLLFGTDQHADDYVSNDVTNLLDFVKDIYKSLNISRETIKNIHCKNLYRFLGTN